MIKRILQQMKSGIAQRPMIINELEAGTTSDKVAPPGLRLYRVL